MSSTPPRPSSVPADAVYNAADTEWELGQRRGERYVGEWTWWRPDGTRVGTSPFDDEGRLHGVCRRWHPNGELSLEAPYTRGVLHGRQIMTRVSTGDSPENPVLLQLEGVYRMDTLHVDGDAQGIATFYDKAGLLAPIQTGADGRSIDLGDHLGKLRPTTALDMVTPFFHTMTGKLPSSMVSFVRYLCLAMVNTDRHRLQVIDDEGAESLTIATAAEISRALTLAVDHRAAKLTPPST